MNKKYLPSALILYLNYFIHGVGCSILGQAVIKEALAAAWGVEAMAITAISAALGLGRLIALLDLKRRQNEINDNRIQNNRNTDVRNSNFFQAKINSIDQPAEDLAYPPDNRPR